MAQSRRLKAFRLDPYTVAYFLTGKVQAISVPDGIEVVRYGHQGETNSAIVICSHPDWPEVEDGKMIPFEDITMKVLRDS